MLKIRKEQMAVFQEFMRTQFEDQMVRHLRSRFGEELIATSEQDLRTMIRAGTDKAARYEVTTEDDVRCYLEFMVTLGSDFDTNPACSWAGDILREEHYNGTAKMDRLGEYELFLLQG